MPRKTLITGEVLDERLRLKLSTRGDVKPEATISVARCRSFRWAYRARDALYAMFGISPATVLSSRLEELPGVIAACVGPEGNVITVKFADRARPDETRLRDIVRQHFAVPTRGGLYRVYTA